MHGLIEQLGGGISTAVGDGRYAQLAAANDFTAANTFDGDIIANNRFRPLMQTFANATGAIGTIVSTNGPSVEITGTNAVASGTLNLPASPLNYTLFWISNKSTAQFILSGNGHNINGAASYNVEAAAEVSVRYNGTEWTIADHGQSPVSYDFQSPTSQQPIGAIMANASVTLLSNNDAILQLFRPSRRLVVTKFTWISGGASGNYDVAIYSSSGTKLWSKGSTAWPAAGEIIETVSPSVILDAGQSYYLAFAGDNTTGTQRGVSTTSALNVRDSQGNLQCLKVATSFPLPSPITPGTTVSLRYGLTWLREA